MYQNLKLTLFFLEDLGGMILIVSTKKNYQIIFFKKINIKKRGFGKYEYLDEKLYGNHRVLLLAFNIHMRKTIPKSQIG
jgi:hypothetical protein